MNKLYIIPASILLISGAVFAAKPDNQIVAEDKPPLVVQVENHEERIGDLETKTDATQTQVNQNTADIAEVQTQTSIKPAPQVQAVVTPVAQPEPTTQVAPEPVDTTDGWTVTQIIEKQPANATYPDKIDLHCKFIFHNGQVGWGITTTSNKYSQTPASCASNYYTNVGQVMTLTQRNNLRYDTAPF